MSRAGICSNRAGFTLIELMVVVVLLVLFSALTVPLLTGVGADALPLAARRLAGSVKYLFNEAALSGRPYRLTYDLDGQRYLTQRQEANGELTAVGGLAGDRKLGSDVRFEDVTVVGRGKFTSGQVTTVIQPIGWLEETIVHLQSGRRQLTLHIQPYTGTTRVYEGYREFDNQSRSVGPGR